MSENRPAKLSTTTSASQAYTPEKLAMKEQALVGNPQTMRIANFKMGFESATDYGTTTDQNNKFFKDVNSRASLSKVHKNQVMAQKDRVMMNRQPHYDFGRTKVDYKTSNKDKFTPQDLSQAKQSQLDAAANGKDVR